MSKLAMRIIWSKHPTRNHQLGGFYESKFSILLTEFLTWHYSFLFIEANILCKSLIVGMLGFEPKRQERDYYTGKKREIRFRRISTWWNSNFYLWTLKFGSSICAFLMSRNRIMLLFSYLFSTIWEMQETIHKKASREQSYMWSYWSRNVLVGRSCRWSEQGC